MGFESRRTDAFAKELPLFVPRHESRREPVVSEDEKLKAESGGRRPERADG
jgi:hypothetical protein